MPKKSAKRVKRVAHKAYKHISETESFPKVNQLSLQIWVALAAIVIFLLVMFYQMMSHSIPLENPNFLSPEQQIKPIPLDNPDSNGQ